MSERILGIFKSSNDPAWLRSDADEQRDWNQRALIVEHASQRSLGRHANLTKDLTWRFPAFSPRAFK